jgi:peptidoglycan/LPS O-acetylase OafA/YrhL
LPQRAEPHCERSTHQRPHHRVTKSISPHLSHENTVLITTPPEGEQSTYGGRPRARFAEGRKIMKAREAGGSSIHRHRIEMTRMPQSVRSAPGVTRARRIGDAVLVVAPQRRKSSIESTGSDRHLGNKHIGRCSRNDAVQTTHHRLLDRTATSRRAQSLPLVDVDIDMGDLPGRMNSRISAACHHEAHHRLRVTQQSCQRIFHDTLHRAQARLTTPPRERCSVVGQVEPQAHSLHNPRVYGAQFDQITCEGDARATMSAISVGTTSRDRLPGLDGLRALAIVLVLAYHLFPSLAPGGFLGVDIFLVVSGYLITALLVAEHRAHGRIALRRFWGRRARRLLPALIVVVGLTSACAALIGGDVLVGIGWQLAGVLTFSSNWFSIAQGSSYLDQTSPELFRHAWSLAVEEQFYLFWPLLLLLVLLIPVRSLRVALPLALAVGSAIGMAVLAGDPGQDPATASTAYLSTLTHGFGLLLGAALALGTDPLRRRPSAPSGSGWVADAGVLLSAGALIALSLVLSIDAIATYRGGLVAASLLTGVLIMCLAHPSGRAASIADAGLARWIGERSYGLYLWHWPVLILLGAAFPAIDRIGEQSWILGLSALAISLVLAAASYRFVEQPVRTRQIDSALRGGTGWSMPRRLALGAAAVLALVGMVAAGAWAVTRAPAQSEAAILIAAGQASIEGRATDVPLRVPMHERNPTPPLPSALPIGGQIFAVGDSVMLAAAPQLQERFPGIAIDATVSRQMRQAPDILRALCDTGQLREVMIIGLGTNGPIDPATLQEIRSIIGAERSLILVSTQAPRGWIPGVNVSLGDFADYYREVVIADWHGAIAPQLSLLARDQVHPGSAGGRIYTVTVEGALQYLADLPDRVDYEANPELNQPR